MTDNNIRARVEAGMAWLDSFKPGWERSIDFAALDMANGCDCILGQALRDMAGGYSGFEFGLRRLGYGETAGHGFSLFSLTESWHALEAEWRDAIKARFDAGVLSDDVVRPA